jgi:hypothetical protein
MGEGAWSNLVLISLPALLATPTAQLCGDDGPLAQPVLLDQLDNEVVLLLRPRPSGLSHLVPHPLQTLSPLPPPAGSPGLPLSVSLSPSSLQGPLLSQPLLSRRAFPLSPEGPSVTGDRPCLLLFGRAIWARQSESPGSEAGSAGKNAAGGVVEAATDAAAGAQGPLDAPETGKAARAPGNVRPGARSLFRGNLQMHLSLPLASSLHSSTLEVPRTSLQGARRLTV